MERGVSRAAEIDDAEAVCAYGVGGHKSVAVSADSPRSGASRVLAAIETEPEIVVRVTRAKYRLSHNMF